MGTIEETTKAVRHAAYRALLSRLHGEAKTQSQFERMVNTACRDFYTGKIDDFSFIERMTYSVREQYERAFNAGLRDNGIEPADAKDEWLTWLEKQITGQDDFIIKLADDIVAAREAETGTTQFKERATLWANRYSEIQNETILLSSKKEDLLEWMLGATEEHCSTCAALNGAVATVAEWEASGYHPQGAPNGMLECGGWRCDCSLVPTDAQYTGIPNV